MIHSKRGRSTRVLIPNIGVILKAIPLRLCLDHSWFRIPGGSMKSQSCEANFDVLGQRKSPYKYNYHQGKHPCGVSGTSF